MSKFSVVVIIILTILGFYVFSGVPSTTSDKQSASEEETPLISTIAEGLEVPWALAFLLNGDILVTERIGRVRIIKNGNLQEKPITTIAIKQTGESGLHGIAVDPDFNVNNFVYIYYTYLSDSNNSLNRVSRFIFQNNSLTDEKIIVDKIPGAIFHDGGRIKFGPDGYLYITTGDALEPSRSQNKNSLAGKILRVRNEGTAEIYSYGHRNPQGIAWDDKGQLWETEHGQSATDEVNQIIQDKNYGWPTIRGDEKQSGMENPKIQSGSDTWAPAGIAYYSGSLYFAGLRGQALYQLNIETLELKEHFKRQLGRIRDVVLGPDNMFYITTSNRDGRGSPAPDDDKILRINPEKLE